MFSRSRKGSKGFGFGSSSTKDSQVNHLLDLGLVSPKAIQDPYRPGTATTTRTNNTWTDAPSFPEKNVSIARGTGQRSNASVRSGDSAHRRGDSYSSNNMASGAGRNRRERTFVGSECAVCEEPLEHTLRGERILQFSCSHVSHEACFYEFIREFESQYCPSCDAPLHLDTSRGGNVLDIEKISNLVRSVSSTDTRSNHTPTPTATPWDNPTPTPRPTSIESNQRNMASTHTRESAPRSTGRDRESSQPPASERYGPSRHARSDSEATGVASSGGYPETTQSGPPRRHDYDVQAMETTPGSPRAITRNPIPAPTVTVRSEFPTINRSRQQQTLTCLITVEVPDNKWRPDPEDLGSAPPGPPAVNARIDEAFARPPSPARSAPRFYPYESREVLEEQTENLRNRVDNWHGLDFSRFGKLRLYGTLRVGKDKASWQELECFLFAEMLICVKEKKVTLAGQWDENGMPKKTTRCTLKGSILIKKHLNEVSETGNIDENILTLNLSVAELPQFHLRFENRNQLKLWHQALLDLNAVETSPVRSPEYDRGEFSETDEDDWQRGSRQQRVSSIASSWGGPKSTTTAPTEYTNFQRSPTMPASIHVPIDVVVVVPISSSMQGVKINLVRDALKFMVNTLGERDRMGLVTFGSGGGGVPIVGMTTKAWPGWGNVLGSIKPVGQKSHRADVVEGANVAMDLLMQRKYNNPIATIMLISDASTSDADSVDFVVSRAEAAKITIHSFGLGMTHKPDTMIELSTRTKASYTYVKDWMMLRECLAGCLGAMQTLSHQNVKLKLKLPEGSPAKFHKISGALQITKRATGRDAEASLGDLRFGDKRDVLVQLVIVPDNTSQEQLPQDPWDNIVSGLEALGGAGDGDDQRVTSVEEVPLIQADLTWGDILRDGTLSHLPRPSLLAITMLPAQAKNKNSWAGSPPIPPHPHIVQRRMELLTSDMLTRALTLVSRGQHDRAHTLLNETRSILKGLGKGGLPPIPPPTAPPTRSLPSTPHPGNDASPSITPDRKQTPSPTQSANSSAVNGYQATGIGRSRSNDGLGLGAGIDANTVAALDHELESSLEWISHPAVFGRDSRKAVLQAIGVISSQRAFTFRTPIESLWSGRVAGVKKLTSKSREWREEGGGEGGIMEEA
ncbi:von Willebrand factor type A domain-containing protein [Colletotrichum paranaense]|uniref:von Willebrand factor type A domain-containing protein n=1 Tax=Colletotrichum paranaense TaxID=1914294 RepID=A0ABQ9T1F6_9PEZI|nr:von Willebrand factor type A domain-containing protein [Colletotrichum paranaense]KAK1545621.1 von Willebrand factor type A domain-containing protein [Colletotrichum paranaense]